MFASRRSQPNGHLSQANRNLNHPSHPSIRTIIEPLRGSWPDNTYVFRLSVAGIRQTNKSNFEHASAWKLWPKSKLVWHPWVDSEGLRASHQELLAPSSSSSFYWLIGVSTAIEDFKVFKLQWLKFKQCSCSVYKMHEASTGQALCLHWTNFRFKSSRTFIRSDLDSFAMSDWLLIHGQLVLWPILASRARNLTCRVWGGGNSACMYRRNEQRPEHLKHGKTKPPRVWLGMTCIRANAKTGKTQKATQVCRYCMPKLGASWYSCFVTH